MENKILDMLCGEETEVCPSLQLIAFSPRGDVQSGIRFPAPELVETERYSENRSRPPRAAEMGIFAIRATMLVGRCPRQFVVDEVV